MCTKRTSADRAIFTSHRLLGGYEDYPQRTPGSWLDRWSRAWEDLIIAVGVVPLQVALFSAMNRYAFVVVLACACVHA